MQNTMQNSAQSKKMPFDTLINTITIIVIVVLLFRFSGCNKVHDYEFLFDPEEIVSIEIVVLGEYNDETGLLEENVISVVEDHEAFLDDFRSLECRNRFMDPLRVNEGYTVIKLTYSNGGFELIFGGGRGVYYPSEDGSGGKFRDYDGYQSFGEEFYELIEKYS